MTMPRCRIVLWLGVVLVLLLQASPHAIGTVTVTTTTLSDLRTVKYGLAWVSDATGAVSGNPLALRAGFLVQIKFIPDASDGAL